MQSLDYRLFQAINGMAGHNSLADNLMKAIANYGPLVLLAILALLWFLPSPSTPRGLERRVVIYALLVAAIGVGVNQLIGGLWARPRPGITHHVTQLITGANDASFPSDHATLAFGLALPVLLYLRRWGLLLLLCALVVGFARVYVGRHYPGDVAGSVVVALLLTALVWACREPLERLLVPIFVLLSRAKLASVEDAQSPAAVATPAAW